MMIEVQESVTVRVSNLQFMVLARQALHARTFDEADWLITHAKDLESLAQKIRYVCANQEDGG